MPNTPSTDIYSKTSSASVGEKLSLKYKKFNRKYKIQTGKAQGVIESLLSETF